MRLTLQNPTHSHTALGDDGHFQEQHSGATHRNLPPAENRAIGVALAWSAFYALAALIFLIASIG